MAVTQVVQLNYWNYWSKTFYQKYTFSFAKPNALKC